jgi:hypothetical protein
MSKDEAKQAASLLCSELMGTSATAIEVTRQCAYSSRRQNMVREWNVLCDSSEGQYLVRINADTQRIYGINRMDNGSEKAADEYVTESFAEYSLTEPMAITRSLAEERALAYLRIVGVPSQGLKKLEITDAQYQTAGSEDIVSHWNFTYCRSVPGFGKRLLKVSINGETGRLEHVWNPVSAL